MKTQSPQSLRKGHSLECLESRIAPAMLDVTGGVLTYTAGAGIANVLTISVSGGNYSFNDTGETIMLTAGATVAGFTGNNTNTVTGPDSMVTSISVLTGDLGDMVGISAANDQLTVDTQAGTDTINVNGPIAAGAGSVSLSAETVTQVAAGTIAGTAGITLTADTMALAASINAGTGRVILQPLSAAQAIDLGTETGGKLSLTATEINFVTGSVLQVGSATSGALDITAAIAPTGSSTLALFSGAGATENATGSLTVANLKLSGAGPFTLDNVANDVTTIAANLTSAGTGTLSYTDANALSVGNADGTSGITTTNSNVSLTTVNGNLNITNANITIAPDVNAGSGVVVLTAGSVGAATDNTLTIEAKAGVTGTGGITFIADHISILATGVSAGTNTATLRPFQDGTLIDVGGNDAANTLGLDNTELSFVTAGIIVVGDLDAGNLTVTAPLGSSWLATRLFLRSGGTITDGMSGAVTVANLAAEAVSGITLDSATSTFTNFEGETDTGGIALVHTGALTIGGVTSDLDGLEVITSGDLVVTNTGSITLTDTDSLVTVFGGDTSGNVTLTANGATSNITSTVNRDAVIALKGNIMLTAGQDIILGNGADFDNDVRANGSVTLMAGRDITLSGLADVASDDFFNDTGGSVILTAGRNIGVLTTNGDDASVGASSDGGGDVTLTTGANGTLTLSVSFPGTVFSNSGDVTVNADRVVISGNSGITADSAAGHVTIQQVSAAWAINLGSMADNTASTLELSNAELGRIFTPVLRIGALANTGNITVSTPISPANSPTLSLRTAGALLDGVAGEGTFITVPNLALRTASQDSLETAVTNLAFTNTSGAVVVTNSGALTIGAVDGISIATNSGGAVTLTATSPVTFAIDTTVSGTITATATESAGAGDNVIVNPGIIVNSSGGNILLRAGDCVILRPGSVLNAPNGSVTLAQGFGDTDGISCVQIEGTVFSQDNTLTLQGGAGEDCFTIGNLDNFGVSVVNVRLGAGDNVADSVVVNGNPADDNVDLTNQGGSFVRISGFGAEVRIFDSTTIDTLLVSGKEGNDTITAAAGVEGVIGLTIDGDTGNDVLTANATLVGGAGDDTLIGGDSANTLLGDGGAEFAFGLTTTNQLIRFSPEAPAVTLSSVGITGLQGGETILAIDVRPGTGQLYGLGSTSRLYTINPSTGVATQVGTGTFAVALNGTSFGFDFNPTVDLIRVVSDADQNLRLNPDTGAVVDSDTVTPGTQADQNLNYAAGDAHFNANPNVVGSAYTNDFAGATGTTLFGIDSNLDIVVTQNPPGSGTLNTQFGLGFDVSDVLGFDIVPGTNIALASMTVGGVSGLYRIDLNGCSVVLIDKFAAGTEVKGLAVVATNGNDTLTGGLGVDLLNGGLGTDRVVETRDADFTLTNTTLVVGGEGTDKLASIEQAHLIGGGGANLFAIGAFTGHVTLTGAGGSDTVSYAGAAVGVTVDLDLVGSVQNIDAGSTRLQLTEAMENFIGSKFIDRLNVDAAPFARTVNGGLPSTAPGDLLIVDAKGQFATVNKTDANTGTVNVPGFATITYDEFETLNLQNSTGAGGFFTGGNAFSAATIYPTGKAPTAVAIGDVTNDGIPDIVTANGSGASISVLAGNGNGTFKSEVRVPTGGQMPRDVVLGDIEGDGDLDAVVANRNSHTIAVFINDGAGFGFGAAPNLVMDSAKSPQAVALGDVNGDMDLDIAAVSQTGSMLSIFLSNGTGGFGAVTKIASGGHGPTDVAIADFNKDGHGDIAIINRTTRDLAFFAGNGSGNFATATQTVPIGSNATALAVADFNHDGALDIAVNRGKQRAVAVVLGTGAAGPPQFVAPLNITMPKASTPGAFAAADFNGDGDIDLALAGSKGGVLRVMLGLGSGLFGAPIDFDLGNAAKRLATALATGDLNGDGAPDVVLANGKRSDISVVLRTLVV